MPQPVSTRPHSSRLDFYLTGKTPLRILDFCGLDGIESLAALGPDDFNQIVDAAAFY